MNVHRIRFVPFNAQAINCLAFTGSGKLVLSRADGSIEIWNPAENWLQEIVIPSAKGSSIESLVCCGDRLFTAGLNGLIQEWDTGRQQPVAMVESFGVPIWCLAVNQKKECLAAGCEDGSIKLYSIGEDKGDLSYMKTFSKQEGRVMSLAWSKSGKYLISGGVDSTIRKYKAANQSCDLRITLDDHQVSKNTIVWDLKCLDGLSIVSALSTGKLQIFDGKMGTLIQSFESHMADILTIAVSTDERTLFASGIDQKVVRLQRIASGQFVASESVLVHTHDVRALAISSSNQLVSGGIDTQLILYNLEYFGAKKSATIFPPFSHHCLHYQLVHDILVTQQPACLQFWKLQSIPDDIDTETTPYHPSPVHLLKIKSSEQDHIKCFTMNSEATLCAIATSANQIWIYQLSLSDCKATSLTRLNYSAHKMTFVQQDELLLCSTEGDIDLVKGTHYTNMAKVMENTKYLPSLISTNNSSQLVVLCYVDQPGVVVDVVNCKIINHIPKLSSLVTAVCFYQNHIVLCCASHDIFCYNFIQDRLKQWLKADNSSPLMGPIKGVFFIQSPKPLLALYSHQSLALIDYKQFEQHKSAGMKRTLEDRKCSPYQLGNLSVFNHFNNILFAKATEQGGLCVVEKPWEDILAILPPALLRHKYGAS
ncbi:U3 small nucleolar RNA-associated protein 4 homolog [Dysidea avara]|uniref:U3 small nucleolar RNA-associated protein 4 homolog n=1 Tax=Dysidea avara TaxID=196820 RepID=UPI003330EC1F